MARKCFENKWKVKICSVIKIMNYKIVMVQVNRHWLMKSSQMDSHPYEISLPDENIYFNVVDKIYTILIV